MLVARRAASRVLLDFFVEAPGARRGPDARAELLPIDVSFGDAVQVFNVGAGLGRRLRRCPAGLVRGGRRFGTMPLAELAAPAARAGARGRRAQRASRPTWSRSSAGSYATTPECARAVRARRARCWREGDAFRNPELGDALERLGARGRRARSTRARCAAVVAAMAGAAAGLLTARGPRRLPSRSTREPVRAALPRARRCSPTRRRRPAASLIAYALALLERAGGPPRRERLVDGHGGRPGRAHARVPRGPGREGFLERSWPRGSARRRTSPCSTRDGGALQRDLLERRGRRDRRPGHRHPPQQHAGRAGPQPARLPPPPARAGGCRA